ncbi:hypothetical protein [Nonomuraea sp. CA-141351]
MTNPLAGNPLRTRADLADPDDVAWRPAWLAQRMGRPVGGR